MRAVRRAICPYRKPVQGRKNYNCSRAVRVKTLRLQLRFLIPLLLIMVATAYFALPLMDQLTLRWFARDLNTRGELMANTLSEPLAEALAQENKRKLQIGYRLRYEPYNMKAIQMCRSTGMPRKRERRSFSRIAIMVRPKGERKMNPMAPTTRAKQNKTKK